MPDVFSTVKRSEVMSRIRGLGNADTELAFLSLLRTHGIKGWRRHLRVRIGEPVLTATSNGARRRPYVTPDFVFSKSRLAVFIDGCFWHACPLHATFPETRADFWTTKLNSNKARDRLVSAVLRRKGWQVIRIWEHELGLHDRIVKRMMTALGRSTLDVDASNRTVALRGLRKSQSDRPSSSIVSRRP